MLDEKSIWRVGDFLTRGAEEHGVLQVDEASLYRHVHIPLAAGWDGPLMTTPREVTEICAKDIGLATFKASVSGSKPGPLATSDRLRPRRNGPISSFATSGRTRLNVTMSDIGASRSKRTRSCEWIAQGCRTSLISADCEPDHGGDADVCPAKAFLRPRCFTSRRALP